MRTLVASLLALLTSAPVRGQDAGGPGEFLAGGWCYHLARAEAGGFGFGERGEPRDPFRSLAAAGWTHAGLELLTNQPLHGVAANLNLAERARAAGLGIVLNLLYEDRLGGRQIPAGWPHDPDSLARRVYDYTLATLRAFDSVGARPAAVKIGNESDHAAAGGFLLPVGSLDAPSFYRLLGAGIRAVRAFDPRIRIILHSYVPRGNQPFWRGVLTHRLDFDILGVSMYPHWGGYLRDSTAILAELAAYGKPIMVVETATPWTPLDADDRPNTSGLERDGFDANPLSAYLWYRSLHSLLRRHPLGVGVFAWPTTYPAVPGHVASTKDDQTFWHSRTAQFQALPAAGIAGRPVDVKLHLPARGAYVEIRTDGSVGLGAHGTPLRVDPRGAGRCGLLLGGREVVPTFRPRTVGGVAPDAPVGIRLDGAGDWLAARGWSPGEEVVVVAATPE